MVRKVWELAIRRKRYMIIGYISGGKMRIIFWLLFIIGTALSLIGCSGLPAQMPEDFSLSFDWNTGSLPPKYRYSYVITIGPGPQGEFEYILGYSGKDPSEQSIVDFSITEERMNELFQFLNTMDIFRSRWDTGRELIGGSTTSLIITAFGKEYHVPSISELEGADKELIGNVMEKIRGYVPDDVWEELNANQTLFEERFQD